jgi:pantoate--beta-alanine ligase
MKVVTTVAAARAEDRSGRRVLVPTMGALHRGHLELIHVARDHAALGGEVVVSSFVNPLQFEPGSDFDRYPRLEKADEELCASAGVDFLFRPGVDEMYFDDRSVVVDEMMLSQTLCGQSRPGHFRGVCTVVAKIFNVLQPAVAVFGEKDFQQLAIVRRMVRDLNFPVQIIGVPTVREEDGLALSSRNQYLSAPEREQAPILRRALLRGAELVAAGEKIPAEIVRSVRATVEQASLARVDYIELVDASTLHPVERTTSDAVLALAFFFGKTRLIDNIRLP